MAARNEEQNQESSQSTLSKQFLIQRIVHESEKPRSKISSIDLIHYEQRSTFNQFLFTDSLCVSLFDTFDSKRYQENQTYRAIRDG